MRINNVYKAYKFLINNNVSLEEYIKNLGKNFHKESPQLFNLIRKYPQYYLNNLDVLFFIRDNTKDINVPLDIQKKYPVIAIALNSKLLFRYNIDILYDLPIKILLMNKDHIFEIIKNNYNIIKLYKFPSFFIERYIDDVLDIAFEGARQKLLLTIPVNILLKNIDLLKKYIKQNPFTSDIGYLPDVVLKRCIDVLKEKIIQDPNILADLSKNVLRALGKDFILKIVEIDPGVEMFVPYEILYEGELLDEWTIEDERYYIPRNIEDINSVLKFLNYFKRYQQCSDKNSKECKQLRNILIQLINSNNLLDKLKISSINDILKFDYEEIKNIIYNYLNQHDNDKMFRKRIVINPYDEQKFISNKNELVFILYWSPELYNLFINDPIILKFIRNDTRLNSHFIDRQFLNTPIGWALVYQEKDAWYINQIQSDIITKLIQKYKQLVGNFDKARFDLSELYSYLKRYNRGDYIRLNLLSDKILNYLNLNDDKKLLLLYLPELDNLEISDEEKYDIGKEALDKLNEYLYSINYSELELEHIKEKLNWLLNNWYEIIFHFVMQEAIKAGVKHVYMNTSTTINSDLSATAKQILYEKKPKELGMEKKKSDVRGVEEEFWYRENKNRLKLLKLANYFDNIGMYRQADNIESIINNPQLLLSKKLNNKFLSRNQSTNSINKLIENILKEPNTIELLKVLLSYDGSYLLFVPYQLLLEHPELCLAAIKSRPNMMVRIPEVVLENNPEICEESVKSDITTLRYVPSSILVDILKKLRINKNNALRHLSNKQKGYNIDDLINLYNSSFEEIVANNLEIVQHIPPELQLKYRNEMLNVLNKRNIYLFNPLSIMLIILNLEQSIRNDVLYRNKIICNNYNELKQFLKTEFKKLNLSEPTTIRFIVNENGMIYYSALLYHDHIIMYTNSSFDSSHGIINNNTLTRLDVDNITKRYWNMVLKKLEDEGVYVPDSYWERFAKFAEPVEQTFERRYDEPELDITKSNPFSIYRAREESRKRGKIPLTMQGDYIIDDAYYKAYDPNLKDKIDIIKINRNKTKLFRLGMRNKYAYK